MTSDTDRRVRRLGRAEDERCLAEGTIVPARITAALDMRGLWGPEVDVALGGVEPMVDEWEAGTRTPTAAQVRALSDLTGMAIRWFYRQPVPMTGRAFLCSRRGRGRGCEVVDLGPDAEVVPLRQEQGTLF